jgi:hypothetical protein
MDKLAVFNNKTIRQTFHFAMETVVFTFVKEQ